MPTTRAMARKASNASDDKENEVVLSLRKKPVRRATAKANTAKPNKKTTEQVESAQPLSPKKITQVAKGTRTRKTAEDVVVKAASIPLASQAKRPTRGAKVLAADVKPVQEPQKSNASRTTRNVQTQKTTGPAERHAESRHALDVDHNCQPNRGFANDLHIQAIGQNANDRVPQKRPDSEKEKPEARLRHTSTHNQHCDVPSSNIVTAARPSDNVVDSDDELCGPKTPLRRNKAMTNLDHTEEKFMNDMHHLTLDNERYSLHTPPRSRFDVDSMAADLPQTQKVPLKPAAPSSPQRPMSLARGSTVAYVFHPLPKSGRTSRTSSPSKGPYRWPVTPVDESGNPLETTSRPTTRITPRRTHSSPEARQSPFLTRTPVTRERLVQLFASDTDDEGDSDDSSDQSDSEPETDAQLDRDPYYNPKDDHSTYQAELDSSAGASIDDSIWTAGNQSNVTSPNMFENAHAVNTPQLQSEFMQSSPEQARPIVTLSDDEDETDFESSVLEEPFSTTRRFSSITGDTTEPLPTKPSNDSHDAADDTDELATPRPRQSSKFGTMFKTPHMRSALEAFETQPDYDSLATGQARKSQNIPCIDPAALLQDQAIVDGLAHDLSTSAQDSLFDEADVLLQETYVPVDLGFPPISPKKQAREENPRLSLLLNTEGLCDDEDEIGDNEDDTVVIHHPVTAVTGLGIDQASSRCDISSGDSRKDSFDVSEVMCEGDENTDPATPVPHYALPTLAYDARRKSMPLLGLKTPESKATRPFTAETAVKPVASESFARLLLEKRERSILRRRSTIGMMHVTPRAEAISRPTSAMSIRGRKSAHDLRHGDICAATSTEPAETPAAAPRPRCYTPTGFIKIGTPMQSVRKSPERRTAMSPARSPVKLAMRSLPKPVHFSPVKTPLKPADMSSAHNFTPHPSRPLRAIVALVEVFTLDGSDASRSFVTSLHRLGARTTKTWSDRVTHVVFKDGSPATLQKVRLANMSAVDRGTEIFCVNSRWVTDCDHEGRRVDEHGEEYAVDVTDAPYGSRRRRKSMEPAALKNVEGHVVSSPHGSANPTPRKATSRASAGRSSLASTVWNESPVKSWSVAEPDRLKDKEGSDDVSWDDELANTPLFSQIEQVEKREWLVQQTMPLSKVKKFNMKELDGMAKRRMTTWNVQE